MTLLQQKRINHVALVVDGSSSISDYGLTKPIMDVLDGQVAWLAQLSKDTGDETRVSIYIFSETTVTCVAFDTDVLRLPSLRGHYRPYGGTPLMSGVAKAIADLKRTATMYGDHAFLVFALTDGEENTSHRAIPAMNAQLMRTLLADLGAEWTVGVLVPNFQGKLRVQGFGFEPGNVAIWNTNAAGVAEVGEEIKAATTGYFTARAAGAQGTKNLFSTVTAKTVTQAQVDASNMKAIDPSKFMIIPVALSSSSKLEIKIPSRSKTKKNPDGVKHVEIQPFVEETGRRYVAGNVYYRLTKSEKYNYGKGVALVHRTTRKVFRGGKCEDLIGLDVRTTRIKPPLATDEYEVYVRSTSLNRQIEVGGTVIVFSE